MSRERSRSVALAALVAGGALLLLAAGRSWATVRSGDDLGLPPVHLSGRTLAPGVPALGLVALAGAGGLLAARGLLLRVVAVLVALAGAGAVALTLARGVLPSSQDAARDRARGLLVDSAAASVHMGEWPVVALVAALLVAGAGVTAVASSRTWRGLGARYDAPGATPGAGPGDRPRPVTARSTWDALDRGEDPTSTG